MNLNQIFEDFDRKYRDSYVQVALKDKDPELFKLNRIISDNTKFPKLELISDKLGTIVLNYNTNARIMFKVPNPTYIQHGKRAYYFRRMAERQWKRGINRNNSTFNDPLSYWLPIDSSTPVDFNTIRSAMYPTFQPLYVAIEMLKGGYDSVALSKNFAIAKSPTNKDKLVLFYRLAAIGTVDYDGNIKAPNFEGEIAHEIK